VLSAIEQWRRLGRNAFLEQYGFGEARDWVLRHEGELYEGGSALTSPLGRTVRLAACTT